MIESVKILGVTFNVLYHPSTDDVHPDGAMGYVDHAKCNIHVYQHLPEELMKLTLWHEILHAGTNLMRIKPSEKYLMNDEDSIEQLATLIHNVIKENGLLVSTSN